MCQLRATLGTIAHLARPWHSRIAMTVSLDAQLAFGILEASPDALVLVDDRGTIRFVNRRSQTLFGYPPDQLVGQPVELLVPPALREGHAGQRRQYQTVPVTRHMAQRNVALTALHRDGRQLPVEVGLSPVKIGTADFVLATVRDASERRRVETALREAAAYSRTAIDQAPDAMFTADLHGYYTDVNAAACSLLGYTRHELIGLTIADLIPSEDKPRLDASRQRMLTAGQSDIDEWRLRRKDGTMVAVEVNANILPDGRWQAIVRDLTTRKRVESVLSLHTILVDRMAEGLVLIRASDARIVYTNPRFDQMLGYRSGELIGKPIASVNYDDGSESAEQTAGRIIAALESNGELTTELRNVRKDGSLIWCRARVSAFDHAELGKVWLAVHEDINEQRLAEQAADKMRAQLALAERMASLGTLAAGVAHEINNPLTYVMSNLGLIAEAMESLAREQTGGPAKELLQLIDEARQGAENVRKIVDGMRALSRGGDEHPVSLDLRDVLESAIRVTRHELRQKARLVRDYQPAPRVWGDEARLGQVFINLLVNAAQAIPAGQAEQHEIRVGVSTGSEGQSVAEVADTGVGIAPERMSRVFDPFFTTKAVGGGTGLGLSISHNIVTALGGSLEVDSVVGRGSVFRVVLPPAPASPVAPPPPAPERPLPVARPGKLLVVDDDPLVARSLVRSLREHQVATAANGRQALELLAAAGDFDVIVCDLMMPVMTGMELHAVLARERPELARRMVFITGGAFNQAARLFLDQVPNRRLDKPFSSDRLRAAVSEVTAEHTP